MINTLYKHYLILKSFGIAGDRNSYKFIASGMITFSIFVPVNSIHE